MADQHNFSSTSAEPYGTEPAKLIERSKHGAKTIILFSPQPPCSPLLRRQIAIVAKRHLPALPAQRVHDAGKILAASEQILVEPDSRRMRTDPLEQPRRTVGRQISERALIERPLDGLLPVWWTPRSGVFTYGKQESKVRKFSRELKA